MDFLRRHFRSEGALRGWSITLLIANCLIVVTGATVRMTGSGLGCPTWPKCTPRSFLPEGVHGYREFVEYGNRTLTIVLIAVALAMVLACQFHRDENGQRRPGMRFVAWLVLIGMPLQGVVGGITVWTKLNPFVVGLHLLLSAILIALSVQLVRRAHLLRAKVRPTAPVFAARAQFVGMWLVVLLGIIVTGSGPHAGDETRGAHRTGFDFLTVARVHAGAVWAFVALIVLTLVLLRTRESVILLVGAILQGTLGYLQIIASHSGESLVPMQVLVILHLLGVSTVTALSTNVVLSVRRPTIIAKLATGATAAVDAPQSPQP